MSTPEHNNINTIEISVPISGHMSCTLQLPKGYTQTELIEAATKQFEDADFGELENIEMHDDKIEMVG